MDNTDPTADDPSNAQVIVAEDPNGALVIGGDSAVAEFVAQWEAEGTAVTQRTEITGAERAAAISKAVDLGAVGATAARYVRLRRDVGVGKGETAVLRLWVRGANGKILSNKAISPATLTRTNPAALLAVIAIRAALAQSTQEITEAVQRVEGIAEEVLRLASADRTGDVNGHYRLLRRRVSHLDEGAQLTDTDWSTVAALGPALEVGIERLRDYATRLVRELPTGLKADERATRIERVVKEGRLGEVLRLLVVAEQSLYLWERLRVERVQVSEPQHLDQTIAAAHSALSEHLRADGELVLALHETLGDYGVLQPLEFHRKFSGRKLRAHLTALRGDLDYFVTARGLQVEGWEPLGTPTARDAIRAAKTAAIESGRSLRSLGGKAIDGGLAGISRAGGAVQAKADRWRTEQTSQPNENEPAGESHDHHNDERR